jgi:hypothetical protein
LALYAVTQHTAAVSSKSPQKELDLSPPNSGLFFRPDFCAGEKLWRSRYTCDYSQLNSFALPHTERYQKLTFLLNVDLSDRGHTWNAELS